MLIRVITIQSYKAILQVRFDAFTPGGATLPKRGLLALPAAPAAAAGDAYVLVATTTAGKFKCAPPHYIIYIHYIVLYIYNIYLYIAGDACVLVATTTAGKFKWAPPHYIIYIHYIVFYIYNIYLYIAGDACVLVATTTAGKFKWAPPHYIIYIHYIVLYI